MLARHPGPSVRRAVGEGARALVLQGGGPLFCGGADVRIFAGTTAGQAREMFAGPESYPCVTGQKRPSYL